MTVVPTQSLYVTANFKETQTSRMLVGQPATVKVDALPGRSLKGHVESFAPGLRLRVLLLPARTPAPATSPKSSNVCRCASASTQGRGTSRDYARACK